MLVVQLFHLNIKFLIDADGFEEAKDQGFSYSAFSIDEGWSRMFLALKNSG